MVFGEGKNAEQGDVGAGAVGVIFIESRFVGRAGGGVIFYLVMLFYTALLGESMIVLGSCRITA